MNQGPKYIRLMEKSRGQKSRATVPLKPLLDTTAPQSFKLWNWENFQLFIYKSLEQLMEIGRGRVHLRK
jgi:hypothetical protein